MIDELNYDVREIEKIMRKRSSEGGATAKEEYAKDVISHCSYAT